MKTPVFFDLDGTLTDPKIGIVGSIQYALERLDLERRDSDDLTWCIGPPLLESMERLAGKERATRAVDLYRERFSDIGWKENKLYAGIVDTLRELQEADRTLYVATSKPLIFADRIIKHFGLDEYFSTIYGSELDGTRSDKSELLQFALSSESIVGQAVMVGDRKHDVIGAKSNRMKSIGVTYGYGSQLELQTAGADKIVENTQALLSALT